MPEVRLSYSSRNEELANLKFNYWFIQGWSCGYRSNGRSYCAFTSGGAMLASGYSQNDYNNARQMPVNRLKLVFENGCQTNSHFGLIRQGGAGAIRYEKGICLIQSGDHLIRCGFRQFDYDQAPQVSIGNLVSYPSCKCSE